VLKGDRARFQIFGDTVNTTARTETTGQRDRIHITQELADLFILSGKETWIEPRKQKVFAKGKGEMTTYWLRPDFNTPAQATDAIDESTEQPAQAEAPKSPAQGKLDRLVDWNVDMLTRLLKEIIAVREVKDKLDPLRRPPSNDEKLKELESGAFRVGHTVVDEVVEVVELPPFELEAARHLRSIDEIVLPVAVEKQLRQLVAAGTF
jgi:hypothetical protein